MRLNTIPISTLPADVRARSAELECEDAIMAQIDTLYSVALRYTDDKGLAGLLTEKTVLAALRDRRTIAKDNRGIKPAMLTLLRSMYLRSRDHAAC